MQQRRHFFLNKALQRPIVHFDLLLLLKLLSLKLIDNKLKLKNNKNLKSVVQSCGQKYVSELTETC